jgi:biopolymer transport protein ExbB/TolQ
MNFIASLFYGHLAVSVLNTLFFFWAMAIVYLKIGMLKRQKAALLLNVLPVQLGQEITKQNVGIFIDHLYSLPEKLRDSMMVNRIRKALEFFEVRQNSGDVREMMNSQSEIDAARINGSFILLKAFLWAIPLLGFIGTVIGLSSAIGGMNFSNVSDVSKVVEAINNVTAGLGTAFDATLLGLVLAMTLNFPLNSLLKQEDDNLSNIDAFCNEVLLPRLVDGEEHHAAPDSSDPRALAAVLGQFREEFLTALTEMSRATSESSAERERGIRESQTEFLGAFRQVSDSMISHAEHLDKKSDSFAETFLREFVTKMEEMRAGVRTAAEQAVQDSLGQVTGHVAGVEGVFREFCTKLEAAGREEAAKVSQTAVGTIAKADQAAVATIAKADRAAADTLATANRHLESLQTGITTLNTLLKDLSGKQVVVNVTKKKGWFSRE